MDGRLKGGHDILDNEQNPTANRQKKPVFSGFRELSGRLRARKRLPPKLIPPWIAPAPRAG